MPQLLKEQAPTFHRFLTETFDSETAIKSLQLMLGQAIISKEERCLKSNHP